MARKYKTVFDCIKKGGPVIDMGATTQHSVRIFCSDVDEDPRASVIIDISGQAFIYNSPVDLPGKDSRGYCENVPVHLDMIYDVVSTAPLMDTLDIIDLLEKDTIMCDDTKILPEDVRNYVETHPYVHILKSSGNYFALTREPESDGTVIQHICDDVLYFNKVLSTLWGNPKGVVLTVDEGEDGELVEMYVTNTSLGTDSSRSPYIHVSNGSVNYKITEKDGLADEVFRADRRSDFSGGELVGRLVDVFPFPEIKRKIVE